MNGAFIQCNLYAKLAKLETVSGTLSRHQCDRSEELLSGPLSLRNFNSNMCPSAPCLDLEF